MGTKIKKIIISYLKKWLEKLEPKVEVPLTQEQARIFIRNGRQKKRTFCPVVDKVSYDEKTAKEKANNRKTLEKIRAYRCQFCPYWHLTHKKDKLKFH